MKRNLMIPAILFAAGVATAGGVASAAQSAETQNDAVLALAKTTISLTQAVSAAESHAGGRAVKAELEDEHGVAAFHVEIVTADSKVFEVQVDAKDGTVLSNKADVADDHETDDDDED